MKGSQLFRLSIAVFFWLFRAFVVYASSAEVSVRGFEESDLPRVAILSGELGYPVVQAELRKNLLQIKQNPDYDIFIAEDKHRKILGWVFIHTSLQLWAPIRTEVEGLVVDSGTRGLGVGRKLMERVEEWTRSKGINNISVGSNSKRKDAHQFYLRLGYRVQKQSYFFEKDLK